MARKSFEAQVRELVKANGWELEVERNGPTDTLFWVYTNKAHMWIEEPMKHTECAHTEDNDTVPQTWRELLGRLQDVGTCEKDCYCYD